MRTIAHSWEAWRRIRAVLRAQALPSMLEHADLLQRQLAPHPPGQAVATLHLTDDVVLRSDTWAWLELGIPLPPMER